ncbi:hypothetical protein EGJ86_07225 [Pseudomonas sp. o96-267]|uniref:hypothetical protein n=1 Tax=Pseudomonas sp. o96-267 TaxID=2479853 RepID=UPI000F7AFDD1|nr:hypothetical protein [Pseudomonas sp. o96-267]RRV41268.1 hypothetical protein EGJ86_07225 [Pseudomonas sp. o96-267]
MGFPNSPVDPEIVQWGWPWHGLIQGASAGSGSLSFGSGRVVPCGYVDYHNTHLWDIGMPVPEVETEDPDEQWLSQAIVRSRYLGNEAFASVAYGQMSFDGDGRYPFYTPGYGVMRRQFAITVQEPLNRLRLSGLVFGWAATAVPDIFVSYADAGLGGKPADLTNLRVQFLDNSPDGRRALFAICPWRVSGQVYSIPRSIIEIELRGDPEVGFSLAAHLIAPYAVTWEYIGTGGGPEPSSRYELRAIEAVIWAWYGMDGTVETVKFRRETEFAGEMNGTTTTLRHSFDTTITTKVICGDRVAALVNDLAVTVNYSRNGEGPTWSNVTHTVRTVAGEVVVNASVPGGPHDEPSRNLPFPGSSAMQQFDYSMSGIANPADLVILSNKILAPAVRDIQVPGVSGYQFWCADAVTPAGVDAGLYKIATTSQASNPIPFIYGAFNPLTGAVVRNNPTTYQTWV